MRMKERTYQNRRDFRAIYECEHCGHVSGEVWGYDDSYFHNSVIPAMECTECGKRGTEPSSSTIVPEGVVL